jgi:hypothetical protein
MKMSAVSGTTPELAHPVSKSASANAVYFKSYPPKSD